MGIFSSIKNAIFGKAKAAPAPVEATPAAGATLQPQPVPEAAAPQEVDIEAVLVELDSSDGRGLNWRTSIADLMKPGGLESSLADRKELAQELGYTGALDGSAEMNIWLHKRVMQELAANGGKVPASMLD